MPSNRFRPGARRADSRAGLSAPLRRARSPTSVRVILAEGKAQRASDIDVVWIYGYGFPAYRGGPMFWADQEGLDTILSAVKKYQDTVGGEQWEPAALLEKLVAEGRKFADL